MISCKDFENKIAARFVIVVGLSLIILGAAILSSRWVDDLLLSVISFWRGNPPAPHWLDKLHMLGVDALLSGVVFFFIGWMALTRWPLVVSLAKNDFVLLTVSISVLILLWLPVMLIGHSATIGGERYWWLGDDSMIAMRYARNLADGFGLVWNPGERVEGYTNFLWTVYMTFVHLLPIQVSKVSLLVLLTNLSLAIAVIPVIIRLVRLLGGGTLATVATLAAYVLSKNLMVWAVAGFETTLLTFLLLLSIYRLIKESELNQPKLLTYISIAGMSLVRADAAILSAMLYGVSLISNKNRKLVLIYSAISFAVPIAHEIFRISYYGDVLPNTAYLKTQNWSGRYAAGLWHVLDFATHYAVMIVLAIAGYFSSRKRSTRYILGIFLLHVAYIAYVGGDASRQFRFFAPVIPLLMIVAFLGIQSMEFKSSIWRKLFSRAQQQTKSVKLALSILCLVTMPLVVPGYSKFLTPRAAQAGNLKIGLLLKQNTPSTSRVADFWAGIPLYFSERYAIDLLGKSDRYIARLPAVAGGAKAGHNKFDFDYSLGELKPDYVVAAFKLPVQEDVMQKAATGDWAFVGQLYFNTLFHEHCLPNPVAADTWRTIFVCDWSSQVKNKDKWQPLPFE